MYENEITYLQDRVLDCIPMKRRALVRKGLNEGCVFVLQDGCIVLRGRDRVVAKFCLKEVFLNTKKGEF